MSHGRPSSEAPIVALRGALSGPFPQLEATALKIVRSALKGRTREDAAEKLGVPRPTLQKLLADFPELKAESP